MIIIMSPIWKTATVARRTQTQAAAYRYSICNQYHVLNYTNKPSYTVIRLFS